MNLDDPNLTAYALGELSGDERVAMEQRVAQSAEARAFVEETRSLAERLRVEFANETTRLPGVIPLPGPRTFWSDARWLSLGLAALLAVGALIAAVILTNGSRSRGDVSVIKKIGRAPADIEMEFESADANPEQDPAVAGQDVSGAENSFVATATHPFATFPINSSERSYPEVARFLNTGSRPPKEAVRIEEMLNFFTFNYPAPENGDALSLSLEGSICPWEPSHRLVRIGLKGRLGAMMNGAPETVAKNVNMSVDFRQARVAAYRLIGYEKRAAKEPGAASDNGAGGAIRAGQTVTALFEIVPAKSPVNSPEILSVQARFIESHDGKSKVAETKLADCGTTFAQASSDMKFAAAVAAFGMILRESKYRGAANLFEVASWAEAGQGMKAEARADFLALVRKAQALAL